VRKILFVTNDPNVGGGPRHILNLITGLDHREFQLYLLAPTGWLSAEITRLKLPVKFSPLPESRFSLERLIKTRQIINRIKTAQDPFIPLIIHTHSPKSASLISRSLWGIGAYFIHTEHIWTSDYHTNSWWRDRVQLLGLKQILGRSSKVIAVSQAVERLLIKRKIVPKEKIDIIYPIVGKQEPHQVKKWTKKVGPIAGKQLIGSIGSLNRTKNYSLLIEAMVILGDDLPNLKLEIVGDGPDRSDLEQLILERKLQRSVRILGSISSEGLRERFSKWQAYIQPSISESFGLAVFEAMQSGIPVVASRVGGLVEIIDHEKSGLLCRSGDPSDLAKKIKNLLLNDRLQEKIIKNALKKTTDRLFDGQENLKKTEAIYQQLG